MAARKRRLTDDEAVELARQTAIECMQSATKEKRINIPCEYHPRYNPANPHKTPHHQHNIQVEDWTARLKAAQEVLDRVQGKAATKKEPPKPKTAGRSLDELTDAELETLLIGDLSGEIDGGAAQEAAR